jgi:CDP-diacylglycerol--glycerol-3-phosphate 3-phosphatidyltransferase
MPLPVLSMRQLPLALTALRAALAPAMVVLALCWPNRMAFALCLVTAFLSDVFDGVVARRLGIATPGLRRLDSIADTLFYAGAAFAAWRLHREVLIGHRVGLAVLIVLEALRYGFDFWKFRREASYHMWSSKLWGIALFAAFLALLGFGSEGAAIGVAIALGIVADLEGLAISMVLREWRSDVPTIVHALRLRADRVRRLSPASRAAARSSPRD